MAHVHDKQRIKIGLTKYMAHVHDKQRIKIGNKTWAHVLINKE